MLQKNDTTLPYHAFGMEMPGRKWTASDYRFAFNGKEKATEINEGDFDFGDRILDSRIGRWLTWDKLREKYPFISPYNFSLNKPITFMDPDGRVVTPADSKSKTLYNNLKIALQNSKDEKAKVMLCQLETLEKNPEVNYVIHAEKDIPFHEGDDGVKGITRFNWSESTEQNAIVDIYINKNTDKNPSEAYEALGDEITTAYQFNEGDIGFAEVMTDDRDPNPNKSVSYDSKDEYKSKVGSSTAIDALNELGENKYEKTPDIQNVSDIEKSSMTEAEKNKAIDEKLTPLWNEYGYKLNTESNGELRKAEDAKPVSEDIKGKRMGATVKKVVYRQNNENGNKETVIKTKD